MINSASGVSEFLSTIYTQEFLTLEDLGHGLQESQAITKRLYDEAVEKLAKIEQEQREMKEKSRCQGRGEVGKLARERKGETGKTRMRSRC